ncbi:MAG: phosphatidylserine decarboxylase [Treponema sp.]|jgi:phosphatidylserine decarboxylase|nr:phosphatidylserine decarboxylase [Treponema sp.]
MSILKEGYPHIFPSLPAAAVMIIAASYTESQLVFLTCAVLGSVLTIFALFCVFFFRDPKITVTQGEGIILSPCNGTVMEVTEEGGEKIVRVFLSVFSVHLQRSPAGGTVAEVSHRKGKFLAAWNKRAQAENEQNTITIQGAKGVYTVRQIAGFVARRCVSWVRPGDVLKAGDKIGMIKFGSQVDLHLPNSAEIKVSVGDKTRAGVTVMARI